MYPVSITFFKKTWVSARIFPIKIAHQIKGCQNITGQRLLADRTDGRNKEKNEANESEVEEMVPGLSGDEARFRGGVVLLIPFRGRLDVFGQKFSASISMELELLDAFGERTEVAVEFVMFLARHVQTTIGAGNEQAITDAAEDNERENGGEDLPRQPAEVNRAPEKHRDVDADDRDGHQRLRDIENIVGEGDENSRSADLFEIAQRDG